MIRLRAPDDFHVHLRRAPLLEPVVRETARWFARVLVMPNVDPPVTTAERLHAYRSEIGSAVPAGMALEPLMTFKVVPGIRPDEVARMATAGAIGGKLYPRGVTTNSQDGADRIDDLYPVLEAMEQADLVLEVHAEAPGVFSLEREVAYLPTIERIVSRYPRLRVVIEHVSCAETIDRLDDLPPTVAATVTLHHLLLTLDDVVGDTLRPHHFCKPIAKRPADREALRAAVFSGNPRVFFGSDSAPHARGAKESDCGCAGVYTAPVAVPMLAGIFAEAGLPVATAPGAAATATAPGAAATAPRGDTATAAATAEAGPSMESFVSDYGARFYRLPRNERTITLIEREWSVPDCYGDVVPFGAGAGLRYDVSDGGKA